jgi:antitoxin component YwqK of YwqJK toxin-antitoxin module
MDKIYNPVPETRKSSYQFHISTLHNLGKIEKILEKSAVREIPLNRQSDGEYKTFYDDSQIYLQEFYQNGKLENVREIWYKNGQIWNRSFYQAGKLEGEHKSWHADGRLKTREFYRNGICVDRCLTAGKSKAFAAVKNNLHASTFCAQCPSIISKFLISDLLGAVYKL